MTQTADIVAQLRDAEMALEEATGLMAGSATQAGKGRAFGLTVRALADVTSALAALSPPEITTDARETG